VDTRSDDVSRATVLALDNVPLELPIAGPASRALAAFLDYLIVAGIMLLWGGVCLGLSLVFRQAALWVLALFLVGVFVLEYGYFAGVEVVRGGQTFGKWALGLRTVSRHGGRAGTAALLIRNAVRVVDLLVGVPLMVLDPLARRLGDRLAGTLVLRTPQAAKREIVVVERLPRGWNAEEAALLESFLKRADELEPGRAERLALRILECIEHDDPALAAERVAGAAPVQALRRLVTGDRG
jgi:uncharacterized RDD family membrane protein YckC